MLLQQQRRRVLHGSKNAGLLLQPSVLSSWCASYEPVISTMAWLQQLS